MAGTDPVPARLERALAAGIRLSRSGMDWCKSMGHAALDEPVTGEPTVEDRYGGYPPCGLIGPESLDEPVTGEPER